MKVYIVYNQALHHDSSYNCILDVYNDVKDAFTRIGCEYKDFCDGINRGDFGDDFDEIEIDESTFPINPDEWNEYIVSTKGYYEAWRVEEYEVI